MPWHLAWRTGVGPGSNSGHRGRTDRPARPGLPPGRGRDFAEKLAKKIGASLVLTTSSDRAGHTAPDLLASRLGWKLEGRENLPAVIRELIDRGRIPFWTDVEGLLPNLPEEYYPAPSPDGAALLITPFKRNLRPRQVQLVPRCIAAGMGCRKGAAVENLKTVLASAFGEQGLLPASLAEIRTVEEKACEPGLGELAGELAVPLMIVGKDTIQALEGDFTPSAAERHLGIKGVAEPCAASAGKLLGTRTSGEGATAALALMRRRPGGCLTVVGTGPGDGRYLTLEAKAALDEADAVVGYRLYAELLPPEWLEGKMVETYSMGEEEKRAERAVALAEEGKRVALLSGGDPVLFGLAGSPAQG